MARKIGRLTHHWKKPRRRAVNLARLGVSCEMAWKWAYSRMGGWAVSCSPILTTTITLDRLKRGGYISFLEYYLEISRWIGTGCWWCLNRRIPDRYIRWCERCTGGLTVHRPPTRLGDVIIFRNKGKLYYLRDPNSKIFELFHLICLVFGNYIETYSP